MEGPQLSSSVTVQVSKNCICCLILEPGPESMPSVLWPNWLVPLMRILGLCCLLDFYSVADSLLKGRCEMSTQFLSKQNKKQSKRQFTLVRERGKVCPCHADILSRVSIRSNVSAEEHDALLFSCTGLHHSALQPSLPCLGLCEAATLSVWFLETCKSSGKASFLVASIKLLGLLI